VVTPRSVVTYGTEWTSGHVSMITYGTEWNSGHVTKGVEFRSRECDHLWDRVPHGVHPINC